MNGSPADLHFDTLRCEMAAPYVLLVTLNRPQAANALNTQMGRDLLGLFLSMAEPQPQIRCVVLTGEGERAFCAGGDLKERNGMTMEAWERQHRIYERAYLAIMDSPIPVIAAVNGAAFGGGCEMALACDFAYAAETATFALTETSLGIIPGCGGTQNLPRAVGLRRAKELILSAGRFSAAEAAEWGMINRVCAPGQLMTEALQAAGRIAGNAPIAVAAAKWAMDADETHLKGGLSIEIQAYSKTVPSADRLEGVAAFNEKRPARFEGR